MKSVPCEISVNFAGDGGWEENHGSHKAIPHISGTFQAITRKLHISAFILIGSCHNQVARCYSMEFKPSIGN